MRSHSNSMRRCATRIFSVSPVSCKAVLLLAYPVLFFSLRAQPGYSGSVHGRAFHAIPTHSIAFQPVDISSAAPLIVSTQCDSVSQHVRSTQCNSVSTRSWLCSSVPMHFTAFHPSLFLSSALPRLTFPLRFVSICAMQFLFLSDRGCYHPPRVVANPFRRCATPLNSVHFRFWS